MPLPPSPLNVLQPTYVPAGPGPGIIYRLAHEEAFWSHTTHLFVVVQQPWPQAPVLQGPVVNYVIPLSFETHPATLVPSQH